MTPTKSDEKSQVRPALPAAEEPGPEQTSVGRLAWVLDEAITLPGGQRIGADALVGLIPGVGDIVSLGVSGYIFTTALRAGASKATLLRMAMNSAVDTVIGSIPLIGDLFDLFWRSNSRNVALLESTLQNPQRRSRTDRSLLIGIAGVMLVAFCVIVYLSIKLASWVWGLVF